VKLSICPRWLPPKSAFTGFRFPPEVIVVAVRWYLRFNLSYRDLEELLAERGVQVDHVTAFRWVQRFAPLLADAARFTRHAPGDRWYVDETYVKVNGVCRYVYRAVDQFGQVIDVLVSARRDAGAARRFFQRALTVLKVTPSEVVTDAAPVYPAVLDELIPSAWHHIEQYATANNPIEADHSQLKQRLRPMRGLQTDRTAQVIIAGHAFMQNLRRGHYELGSDTAPAMRVATAFTELARVL
jgi:transposase-like protein